MVIKVCKSLMRWFVFPGACCCAGIAVLADMLLTTHFLTMVMMFVWKLPVPVCLLFYILFAPVEATYWSATLGKVPTGASATHR